MSKFTDGVTNTIKLVAPVLGSALGGPLGGAAGMLIAKALGTTSADGTPDQAATEAAIVAGSPDTLLKIKQAELDFQAHMSELGVQEDQIAAGDRDSARKREVNLKDRVPALIALFVIVSFAVTLGYILTNGKPPTGGDALMMMLGALVAKFTGTCDYYFGSSAGSSNKDSIISSLKVAK